jgi:hypothetical protein
MRYAYFIFILSLFASLHTNAQANKDYKQVKADNIKKIIFFNVRHADTIGKIVREYDKKGRIVKYTDFSNMRQQGVRVIQKKYATDCNGECIIHEENMSYAKNEQRSFHYFGGGELTEYRYTGTGNKRELSAYCHLEPLIEIERKDSNAAEEDMYYLFPKFSDEMYADSSGTFTRHKSVTNFSNIILNNTAILGESRVYHQFLQEDSLPIEIWIGERNDSLENAVVSYLFATGKRTFTIRRYEFVINKMPLKEVSFNFMDSGFHSSLNKLFHISQKTNHLPDSSRIITYPQSKFKLVTKYYMKPKFDLYDSTVTKYKRNHSSYTMKVFNNGKQIKTHIEYLKIRSEDYYVWDTYLELKRSHSKEYKLEYW